MTDPASAIRLAESKARVFKALGHPARLIMFEALAQRPHCVCDLVELVPGSQATTSRHLNVLREAGLVRRQREGSKMIYEIAFPCLLRALGCVTEMLQKRVAQQLEVFGG